MIITPQTGRHCLLRKLYKSYVYLKTLEELFDVFLPQAGNFFINKIIKTKRKMSHLALALTSIEVQKHCNIF